VEDGSSLKCEDVVHNMKRKLAFAIITRKTLVLIREPWNEKGLGFTLSYLRSDCIILNEYYEVDNSLKENYVALTLTELLIVLIYKRQITLQ
jgi:hypothetical protein